MSELRNSGLAPRSTPPSSLNAARPPEDLPVGEGPLYETMRAEARKLVPLFAPGGVENCQPYWGAGICGISRRDGKNVVSVDTFQRERSGLGVRWEESIEILRAAAISLLVYCEAHNA